MSNTTDSQSLDKIYIPSEKNNFVIENGLAISTDVEQPPKNELLNDTAPGRDQSNSFDGMPDLEPIENEHEREPKPENEHNVDENKEALEIEDSKAEALLAEANYFAGPTILKYLIQIAKSTKLKSTLNEFYKNNYNFGTMAYSEIDIGDKEITLRVFMDVHKNEFEYNLAVATEEIFTNLLSEFNRYKSYITIYTQCIIKTLPFYADLLEEFKYTGIAFQAYEKKFQYLYMIDSGNPPKNDESRDYKEYNLVLIASYFNSTIKQFVKSK